jgi:cytoskeletal protein RodZ
MKKNEFGRHLNAIRISKNISLDELANETQIASWVLWLYEEGREIPKNLKFMR